MLKAVLLALVFCALRAEARVVDLHTEIRVAKSGELTVTERITVEARAKTPQLERRLPRFAQVVDVVRNGHPERHVIDGNLLRFGAVPEGRSLYQITYRAPRRIAFLADHDALHWNLAGAERMTAEVILPAAVPARSIKAEASGGEYQGFVRDGRAAFRSQADISFVVRFPKDVVAAPAVDEQLRWFVSDYFGVLLVIALLALSAWTLLQIKRIA